jgi:hypothetical protein
MTPQARSRHLHGQQAHHLLLVQQRQRQQQRVWFCCMRQIWLSRIRCCCRTAVQCLCGRCQVSCICVVQVTTLLQFVCWNLMGSVCQLHARIQHKQQQIVGRDSHHSERRSRLQLCKQSSSSRASVQGFTTHISSMACMSLHHSNVLAANMAQRRRQCAMVTVHNRASRFMSYARNKLHAPAGALYLMFTNDRCTAATLAAQVLLWRQTAPRAAR